MEVKAQLRYLRMSPRKVRLVLDLIKGMRVQDALDQLSFIPKRAALPIAKLLNSAIANAQHNYHLKKDELFVRVAKADQGPTIKRSTPRAFGRADPIRKRSSHITVVLTQRPKRAKRGEKTAKNGINNKARAR